MDGRNIACVAAAAFVGTMLLASTASPAFSQPPPGSSPVTVEAPRVFDPETQRVVSYADLNLANSSGQVALEYRVRAAAHSLCPDFITSDWHDGAARRCFDATMSNALPAMRSAISQAQNAIALSSSATVAAATITVTAAK